MIRLLRRARCLLRPVALPESTAAVLCTLLLCFSTGHAATISGTLRDPQNAPAAEATLWLVRAGQVLKTVSDAKGTYRFPAIAPGPIQIIALKDPYALAGFTGFAVDDARIDLPFKAGTTKPIRVLSPQHQPLPGARVHELNIEGTFNVPVSDLVPHGFPELRSNDAGLVQLPNLPENGFFRMTLRHLDYADAYVPFVPVRSKIDDIPLENGLRIAGRIRSDRGPLAGARIVAYALGAQGQREVASAVSDREGLYSLRVPPGALLVSADHPDFAPAPPLPLELYDGQQTPPLDFTLPAARLVRGTVRYPKKRPAAGVRVGWGRSGLLFDETFTDNNGAFSLRASDAQGVLSIAAPQGFRTRAIAEIPIEFGQRKSVTLDPIDLEALPALAGIVRDDQGMPVPRAFISSSSLSRPLFLLTDDTGQFNLQLAEEPEGNKLTLRVEHPLRFLRAENDVLLDAKKPIEIRLAPYEPDTAKVPPPPGANDLSALEGKPAPTLECAQWYNADPAQAASPEFLKGRVSVLTFWGGFDTSIQGIARLEEIHLLRSIFPDDHDVAFIGIHDSTSEDFEIEEYLRRYRIDYPVGRDADPFRTFSKYNVNAIPFTVLISKSGILEYTQADGRLLELIKVLRRN